MIEFLSEGTIIHSHVFYKLIKGSKRKYFNQPTEQWNQQNDTFFEFDAYMYPPLMMTPLTWQRYNYTREDVLTTYSKMDAAYVWQMALMLLCGHCEPEAASAGVRHTYQSLFSFLFIARKSILDTFINTYKEYLTIPDQHQQDDEKKETNTNNTNNNNNNHASHHQSCLCHERSDHIPRLPKVQVHANFFEKAKQLIPERHPSFCWRPHYPCSFDYKDIEMIPVEYDPQNNLILMSRIVKEHVVQSMKVKPKHCVVTMPVNVLVNHEKYVMLEESCFIYAIKEKKKKKRKFWACSGKKTNNNYYVKRKKRRKT